jgi:hypothetical protein
MHDFTIEDLSVNRSGSAGVSPACFERQSHQLAGETPALPRVIVPKRVETTPRL